MSKEEFITIESYIIENDIDVNVETICYIHGYLDALCSERNISLKSEGNGNVPLYQKYIISEYFNKPIN